MSRYRKIDTRFWSDADILRLSRPQPNGQVLFIYLLTGPHTTSIPGAFVAGEAMLAEALEWPIEDFRKAFAEVSGEAPERGAGKALVKANWKARFVWIKNAIKYNRPESPNVVKSWGAFWDELPECELKIEVHQHFKTFLEGMGEAFLEAFMEACPMASPMAITKTTPNQEQEQEQEQEQKQEQEEKRKGAAKKDPPSSPSKIPFGEFGKVLLTDEEHKKLIEKFGGEGARERITDLDLAIESKNLRYKSHYATILNWDRRNQKNGRPAKPEPNRFDQVKRSMQEFAGGEV